MTSDNGNPGDGFGRPSTGGPDSVPGFVHSQDQSQFPGQQPGYGQQGYGQQGYPQPHSVPYPGVVTPPTSTKAIIALVLGIASIALVSVYGVGGIAAGVPAIILGSLAQKEIRADRSRCSGGGLATGGIITGIIGIVLGVLVGIVMFAFVIVAFNAGGGR